MAKCNICSQEMKIADSCTFNGIRINGRIYLRDAAYFDKSVRCHDCGIVNKDGNVHHYGCDMERCPRCGNQLISCGCKKESVCVVDVEKKGLEVNVC